MFTHANLCRCPILTFISICHHNFAAHKILVTSFSFAVDKRKWIFGECKPHHTLLSYILGFCYWFLDTDYFKYQIKYHITKLFYHIRKIWTTSSFIISWIWNKRLESYQVALVVIVKMTWHQSSTTCQQCHVYFFLPLFHSSCNQVAWRDEWWVLSHNP